MLSKLAHANGSKKPVPKKQASKVRFIADWGDAKAGIIHYLLCSKCGNLPPSENIFLCGEGHVTCVPCGQSLLSCPYTRVRNRQECRKLISRITMCIAQQRLTSYLTSSHVGISDSDEELKQKLAATPPPLPQTSPLEDEVASILGISKRARSTTPVSRTPKPVERGRIRHRSRSSQSQPLAKATASDFSVQDFLQNEVASIFGIPKRARSTTPVPRTPKPVERRRIRHRSSQSQPPAKVQKVSEIVPHTTERAPISSLGASSEEVGPLRRSRRISERSRPSTPDPEIQPLPKRARGRSRSRSRPSSPLPETCQPVEKAPRRSRHLSAPCLPAVNRKESQEVLPELTNPIPVERGRTRHRSSRSEPPAKVQKVQEIELHTTERASSKSKAPISSLEASFEEVEPLRRSRRISGRSRPSTPDPEIQPLPKIARGRSRARTRSQETQKVVPDLDPVPLPPLPLAKKGRLPCPRPGVKSIKLIKKYNAECEARDKAEAEARDKAEAEAKNKAETEARDKAELEARARQLQDEDTLRKAEEIIFLEEYINLDLSTGEAVPIFSHVPESSHCPEFPPNQLDQIDYSLFSGDLNYLPFDTVPYFPPSI